ncbi:hypothetical protein R5H30_13530 [Sulfitobacter sp. D35]|uniref:hypothetical protein n=1 Tax=Sulfitobacter sp. D35 TaxID=3083252 RepID=UPI00296E53AD|nr:hypothetical protein [Sulfitobacter sp. D35]MDW4499011.1 hypothetical protein [Sulfitobacter sp. D35]
MTTNIRKRGAVLCLPILLLCASYVPARADDGWALTGFAGVMTRDPWHDAVQVWDADYVKSGLVGLGLERQFAQAGRFSFGLEVQAVQHFGRQGHFEINTPFTVRYDRQGAYLPNLDSLAFGLGLSWASERPQVEIDRDGDSTQTLFYWMIELAYDLAQTEDELLFRIHHRSDGYGVFPIDTGSNALTIGLRRRF